MHIEPPSQNDYGFYSGYIAKAPATDLLTALAETWNELKELVSTLSEEHLLYSYAPGKWTIKEVLVHLIDAERNFCYRIMRISRGDQAQLPMYNVHEFITNAYAATRETANIMQELELLRKATIVMFTGMHPEMLDKTGPARDVTISVRALGFAMAGHVVHHMTIIKEKYLAKEGVAG